MTPYRARTMTAPRSSFFLFGPRGTGKTTWVRHEYPGAHRVDLLDEALYQSYLADVGRFAARHLPESRLHEPVAPPPAPTLHRTSADSGQLPQVPYPRRARPMAQGRHQHHDQSQIHPPAQKPQRRRRHPLAAPVFGATETETPVVRARQRDAAARLAPVGGHVQLAAAHRTPLPVYLGRDLPVRLQQQLVESCVSEQCVPQRSPPLLRFHREGGPSGSVRASSRRVSSFSSQLSCSESRHNHLKIRAHADPQGEVLRRPERGRRPHGDRKRHPMACASSTGIGRSQTGLWRASKCR